MDPTNEPVLRNEDFPTSTTQIWQSVAGLRAIATAGLQPEDIDVVILATCTPDSIVSICRIARAEKKMGCVNAIVYDVNAACAGFSLCYANKQKLSSRVASIRMP